MYAQVGRLKLTPIPASNNLQLAHYGGLPFVVDKTVNEDDLYLIFMPDGQIGPFYAEHWDLIDRGKDKDGKKLGGYFGKNRKVRSIKLMKGSVTSVGYVAPLDTLSPYGDITQLKEGDEVDTFNGVEIAKKFLVKSKDTGISASKHKRVSVKGFAEHPDTKQFYKEVGTIEWGDLLTLTLKLHGTSARFGKLYAEPRLNPFQWLLATFMPWKYYKLESIAGTRRVVLTPDNKGGWYGSHDLWLEWAKRIEPLLLPGEVVYGEIVGWMNQKPIQSAGGVNFTYGVPQGQSEFYVYNVRQVLPNGYAYDLSWNQIKRRCTEMGLKHVPEVCESLVFAGTHTSLGELVYSLSEGKDPLGDHLREGVVLRIENSRGTRFLKSKSAAFYVLEDVSKNAGVQDIEEANDA